MENNPYTSAYAPQMMNQQIAPAQMQATPQNMNQLMQQQNQLVQQAAQPPVMGGNTAALAQMLRGMGQTEQPQDGVSGWDNAKAWWNSKFNRDESVM